MSAAPAQIGVILAGGASRRLPGGKPAALLAGRPLLGHAVDLVRAAGLEPVVCARASTELPPVDAPTWTEPKAGPDHAPHPLAGVAFALERAAAPIVVVPVDLPFLPAPVLAALAGAPAPGAVLGVQGRPAALVAGLSPTLAPELRAAAMAGAPRAAHPPEPGRAGGRPRRDHARRALHGPHERQRSRRTRRGRGHRGSRTTDRPDLTQPPMALIGRAGGSNPGSFIP